MSKIIRFLKWTEALVDYFIYGDSTVIFVTDKVIENIGKQYDIDIDDNEKYLDNFFRSILFMIRKEGSPNEKGRIVYQRIRNDLFCKWRLKNYLSQNEMDQHLQESLDSNKTLFDFAVFLSNNIISNDVHCSCEIKFLYFPYVVLALLGFNQDEGQEWSNIKNMLQQQGVYFSLNDRDNISKLFEALIRHGALNYHCTYTKDPYIKYLKYHSVLIPSKLKIFKSILYNHNILWDKGTTYNEIRQIIWKHTRNTTEYSTIREALINNETRPYFEQMIKTFNPHEYRNHITINDHQTEEVNIEKGSFSFVIDLEELCTNIWTRYVCIEHPLEKEGIIVTTKEIISNTFIVDINSPIWKKYVVNGLNYKDDNYEISSRLNENYYFFDIIDNRWLVEESEPDKLINRPCFLVLNKLKIGQHIKLLEYHHASLIEEFSISKFFGKDFNVYYIKVYQPHVCKELSSIEEPVIYAKINRKSGIKIWKNGKDYYMLDAFPYIEYEGILYKNITISIINACDSHEVHCKKKVVGNKIYLYDFEKIITNEIKITITDNHNQRIDDEADAKSYFSVLNYDEIPNNYSKRYMKYDKWNSLTDNDDVYYSNNIVYPKQEQNINQIAPDIMPNKEYIKSYNRLMGILYSMGETQKVSRNSQEYDAIKKDSLDSAITYIAEFEGLSLSKSELYKLKSDLCELGIISKFYDNGHLYQTSSVYLIPIGKRVILKTSYAKDGRTDYMPDITINYYILYGAYSQEIYNLAIKSADEIFYINYNNDYLDLLPPITICGYQTDSKIPIIVSKVITSENLLSFAGSICNLEHDSLIQDYKISSCENRESLKHDYPIMEAANNNTDSFLAKRAKKYQLRISDHEKIHNDSIPLDLLYNYVQFKKRIPMWIEAEQGGDGNIYFKQDWHQPFFIKKALTLSSCHLAAKAFTFGVDNFLDDKVENNSLFTTLNYYTVKSVTTKTKLKKCLGDENSHILYFKNISKKFNNHFSLKAYKQLDKSINIWWLVLYYNNKEIAFTDKISRKVYMVNDNKFKHVNINSENRNNVNGIFSAIFNLYYEHSHFGEITQWYNDCHLQLDDQDIKENIPYATRETKEYDIIIMKNINN